MFSGTDDNSIYSSLCDVCRIQENESVEFVEDSSSDLMEISSEVIMFSILRILHKVKLNDEKEHGSKIVLAINEFLPVSEKY